MEKIEGLNLSDSAQLPEFEIVKIKKTNRQCAMCEDFSALQTKKKNLTAIISCEGACLRGEVSRRVANDLCFNIVPETTARVCLGGAFTKNTGQRNMVRTAKRVVILEGCYIKCASRMMNGVIPDLESEIIIVDKFYRFNNSFFGINEVTENELKTFSNEALKNIIKLIFKDNTIKE